MAILDSSGLPMAPVATPRVRSEFMRGTRGMTMAGWNPALRPIQDDIRSGWMPAAARTMDLIQNVGWIAGAMQQANVNTVGNGLRLNAQPDHEALGISEEEGAALAQQIERRFRSWASRPYECDIEGRRNFGQMQAAWLMSYFAFGEGLAELPWKERAGGTWGTKIRLIEPWRLSQRNDPMANLAQGVFQDRDGLPIGYLIRSKDLLLGEAEVAVRARDRYGRQRIVHSFDGMVGQVRGVSPMVPALAVARQFDQLANATLMSSIIQAVFAASVTSDTPTDEMMDSLLTPQEKAQAGAGGMTPYDAWFEAQSGWYDKAHINVGVAGRIAHLFPGQKLDFHGAKTPNANYKEFATILLREMARAIGITYEGMTGDYAGVTFSSVRMASDEIFRIVMYRRQNIVAPFCQAAYEAWLEEEIDRGWINFPGGMDRFLDQRAEACRAEWRGAPKPIADDLKAAKSHQILYAMGIVSASQISGDVGTDYEETAGELAREKAIRKRLGLAEPIVAMPGQAQPGQDAAEEDAEDAPAGEETANV